VAHLESDASRAISFVEASKKLPAYAIIKSSKKKLIKPGQTRFIRSIVVIIEDRTLADF
jgi:hypothetical protein